MSKSLFKKGKNSGLKLILPEMHKCSIKFSLINQNIEVMSNCSWKKKIIIFFFLKRHTQVKNFIINHYDIYLIFCLAHQNGRTIIHIIKCDFIEEKCKVLLFHTVQTI